MSKNTNLSFLTDFLTADIVNSRVGMNNVSPQATFDVTGTGKFSGILTLGSTVSNGTYTYTLPSATGTLALTSDIPSVSGYVPYTGATQAVNLGYNSLSASFLRIDGAGPTLGSYLGFKHSTNVTTGADGYTSIYTFGTNTIAFKSISGATTRDFSFSMASITPGVPGGRTFTLPDADGTLALTSQIPTNAVGGTGTLNTIPKFTAASTIGNSNIFDSGSIIYNTNPAAGTFAWQFNGSTIAGQSYGAQVIAGTNASDTGFRVMNAAASINYLVVRGDGLVTLTGALNGTSASFITSNTTIASFKSTSNNYGSLFLRMDNSSESTSRNWGLFWDYGNYGELRIAPSSTNTGDPDASLAALRIASTGAATISATDSTGNRFNPFNTLTITTNNPNLPYDFFGGSILFRNASYLNGVVNSVRIRSAIYDNGSNLGGGFVFEVTPTAGGTLTPALTLAYNGAATFSSSVSTKALSSTTSGVGNLTAYIVNSVTSASGTTGYGLAIESEASAATSYAFTCRNLSGSNTYFLISTETGKVGNVGIGTVSPSEILHLNKTSGTGCFIRFQDTGGGGVYIGGRSEVMELYAGNAERMRITSGGNVLIGTTTDAGYKLDVNGSGRFGAIMLADRISLSSYASLYGKKVVKADNVSSFTFNLSTIFPEMSSAFATNVVGCFGMYTIFRGGQGETGIFSISRNGSSWSSPSYSIQTATGAYSLSTVTGSGTSITLVFNTNVYVMVEVTAMIE